MFFDRKKIIFAKSFPEKQVWTKDFIEHFLEENFLLVQNHLLENTFALKI